MTETEVDARSRPPWQSDERSGTRITGVRAVLTAPAGVPLVIVRVDTSDDGLYGLGCATFTQRPLAVATAVREYLAPQVIGRDPADVTDILHSLQLSGYWRSGPVLNNALSGVDMALWDIKGKQAGLPVWQLIGGRCRAAAPGYVHANGRDIAEVTDAVRAHLENGFRHIRCQVAVPGARTYGYPDVVGGNGRGPGITRDAWDPGGYLRIVPRMFAHLRQELGVEVELLHDVHERLVPIDAVRLAKELEQYHLFFLEDPLAPEDLGWLPALRGQSATPIAIGELFVNIAEYLPLVRDRACDFIRCHLSAIGGITPALRLAAAAELFGIRTAWHGPPDVSPVGHAANLALDMAMPNFGIQELYPFPDELREVFPGTPEIRDGHLWPSERPGLGVDFDERLAARYPAPPPLAHGRWTAVRLPDGTVQRP